MTVGRVCIDSGSVDDVVEEMVIRDRKHLSEDGIVLPIIAIDRQSGRMESLPEIVSRGFALAETDRTSCRPPARWWRKRWKPPIARRRPTGA